MKTDGYEWSDNKALIATLTRSCRLENDRVKNQLPIRINLLNLLLYETECSLQGQPFLEALYKAIFSAAYYGMLRISEIAGRHAILASNMFVAENKSKIMFTLLSSKTHRRGSRPQKVRITRTDGKTTWQAKVFCPFEVINVYKHLKGGYYDDNEQFFTLSDHSPVTPAMVRKMLKQLLLKLGLEPKYYNTHSFRAGRATDMLKAGRDIETIKRLGRWRSNAVYKYLKD